MAGKGPAPFKSPDQRRHAAPTPGFRQLPYVGRAGDPPDWPLDTPSAVEQRQWRKLWTLPQAVMWERMRCEDTVALYVRAFTKAALMDSEKMLNEVRQLDAKLGISPRAMMDLRWEIEPPPTNDEAAPSDNGERTFVPRTAT
jgi:hypothetical protein